MDARAKKGESNLQRFRYVAVRMAFQFYTPDGNRDALQDNPSISFLRSNFPDAFDRHTLYATQGLPETNAENLPYGIVPIFVAMDTSEKTLHEAREYIAAYFPLKVMALVGNKTVDPFKLLDAGFKSNEIVDPINAIANAHAAIIQYGRPLMPNSPVRSIYALGDIMPRSSILGEYKVAGVHFNLSENYAANIEHPSNKVRLEPMDSHFMAILLYNQDRAVKPQYIMESLYGSDESLWPNPDILKVYKATISKRLATVIPGGQQLIKTHWAEGHVISEANITRAEDTHVYAGRHRKGVHFSTGERYSLPIARQFVVG